MNILLSFFITAVVLVVVIIGIILALVFVRRNRAKRFQNKFGSDEYDRAVETLGGAKKAQTELDGRQDHVDGLDIRSLTDVERARYQADWKNVQAKFVDQPGQADIDADRLIMEVMQLRDYPVSDFDQRAADISINYPDLVSNYRAAREIANKNKEHKADTEELRQAMIYYRSLFEELLKPEAVAVLEN